MLTLAEVLHDQRDLDRLCADRTRPFSELYEQNELYGYAAILKRVAGLPPQRPVHMVIPHGVGLNGATQWDIGTPCPTVYSFQREYDDALSQGGNRVVIRGASPLVHVAQAVPAHTGRHGTLFFPAHTIRTVHADVEYEPIAERLAGLPEHMRPVRICVYWADYVKGLHLPFMQRGFQVVSAGHMWDPLFAWRLAQLISMHAIVASNEYGTHTAMAVHMGAAWLHMRTPIHYYADPGCETHMHGYDERVTQTLDTLLDRSGPITSLEASCLMDDLLGAHRVLSPEALAVALVSAERRHQLPRVA